MLTLHLPEFPILHTPRLLLRGVTAADAPALFALRSDPQVLRYLGRPPHRDVAESLALIETAQRNFAEQCAILWGIALQGKQPMIGTITLWNMDLANHRAEIGYMLLPSHWRQGIADEAVRAVLEYGFGVLDFHSLEANTDPENEASGRLLEKHGFVQEAYFRENFYFEGRFLDSRIYSKINPKHKWG
jgi:ribosomal-protein-alanine N-acetyltransferase